MSRMIIGIFLFTILLLAKCQSNSPTSCLDPNCLVCPFSSDKCELCRNSFYLWGVACVSACPANASPDTSGRCQCAVGNGNFAFGCVDTCPYDYSSPNSQGICLASDGGNVFAGSGTGSLTCPPNSDTYPADGIVCICNYPLVANPYTLRCQTTCPTGMQPDINRNCVCNAGTFDFMGTCVANCPTNTITIANPPRCMCYQDHGYFYDYPSNTCVLNSACGSVNPLNFGSDSNFRICEAKFGSYCNSGTSSACSICAAGYVANNDASGTCVQCGTGCSACTDPTAVTTSCTGCQNGYYLNAGQCSPITTTTNCAQGTASACTLCLSPALLRNGACVDCMSGGYAHQGNCVTTCPPGWLPSTLTVGSIADLPVCSLCFFSGCQYCTLTGCIICQSGWYMSSPGNCSLCPANCLNCSSQVCYTCNTTFYLAHNGSCLALPTNCLTGNAGGECQTCGNGTYWQNGSCVVSCGNGTYTNGSVCSSCGVGCIQCTSSSNCISCASGFNLSTNETNVTCASTNTSTSTGTLSSSQSTTSNNDQYSVPALVLAIISTVAVLTALGLLYYFFNKMSASIARISHTSAQGAPYERVQLVSPIHSTEGNKV